MEGLVKVERALVSVSDKAGLIELGRALAGLGIEILATEGTARALEAAGISSRSVESVTGFGELLEGRVKTLHPHIHAGILARRNRAEDRKELATRGISLIDLVVVNLYPFEQVAGQAEVSLTEALEAVDIGGVALLRAAAKNLEHVAPVVSPSQYPTLLEELQATRGHLTRTTRLRLAAQVLLYTSRYDALIARYLSRQSSAGEDFPPSLVLPFDKIQDLRYGENPHQAAAFYRDPFPPTGALAFLRQGQGKELSFNNLLDVDGAWGLIGEFEGERAAVVVKHTSPCGVGVGETLRGALEKAWATDTRSAFGSVVALSAMVDEPTAAFLQPKFVEVVVAPAFAPPARECLVTKKNLRLLELPLPSSGSRSPLTGAEWDFKAVRGGLLVQQPNTQTLPPPEALKVVTRRTPTAEEWDDLSFAWKVVKHVKSNAIVLARQRQTLGIGCGQMSRVDAVHLAIFKANQAQLPTQGAVMASDAFFPFRDGVEVAAQAGVRAVIQPGGSVRDAEVIAAADEFGIAMVFTGLRQFRH